MLPGKFAMPNYNNIHINSVNSKTSVKNTPRKFIGGVIDTAFSGG